MDGFISYQYLKLCNANKMVNVAHYNNYMYTYILTAPVFPLKVSDCVSVVFFMTAFQSISPRLINVSIHLSVHHCVPSCQIIMFYHVIFAC